jgi:hypothetical protein
MTFERTMRPAKLWIQAADRGVRAPPTSMLISNSRRPSMLAETVRTRPSPSNVARCLYYELRSGGLTSISRGTAASPLSLPITLYRSPGPQLC